MNYNLVATCMLGIEGLLAKEMKFLSFENVKAENGRVKFCGDDEAVAYANIFLSMAERILINLAEFEARDFNTLFDNIKKIPFEKYIGEHDAFPVVGYSIDSELHSIPNCQSIIKKAIVTRLNHAYKKDWFKETGAQVKIRFSIIKNKVLVGIDTSGDGLYKRGYRAHSMQAPIKETLASAICSLARIFPDSVIIDPCCGSGTLLIEAALKAKNMAPGINRKFAAESFSFINKDSFKNARLEALKRINHNITFKAVGYDISEEAVKLTLENAKKAGVSELVKAYVGDIKDFVLPKCRLKIITNPPYGERLLDIKQAEEIYKIMGKKFTEEKGKGYFIISTDDDFERFFGRVATKKHKLYNGMLKGNLYMFF